jgi:transcriptional regulator of acetoin/glycerol metabolism
LDGVEKRELQRHAALAEATVDQLFEVVAAGALEEQELLGDQLAIVGDRIELAAVLIERLVVLKKSGLVTLEDLPERLLASKESPQRDQDILFPPGGIDLPGVLEDFENQLIVKALDLSNGVKSHAAQLLGLNRTTLVEKMKKKGMIPSQKALGIIRGSGMAQEL